MSLSETYIVAAERADGRPPGIEKAVDAAEIQGKWSPDDGRDALSVFASLDDAKYVARLLGEPYRVYRVRVEVVGLALPEDGE